MGTALLVLLFAAVQPGPATASASPEASEAPSAELLLFIAGYSDVDGELVDPAMLLDMRSEEAAAAGEAAQPAPTPEERDAPPDDRR